MKTLLTAALLLAPMVYADEPCPRQFHDIPLHDSATYCNEFAGQLPVSMSYHAKLTPEQTLTFYLSSLGEPQAQSHEKGREVLHFGPNTLIISADGSGAQIDILIK